MNGAIIYKEGSAALDSFPACCCQLFKRCNGMVCAKYYPQKVFEKREEIQIIMNDKSPIKRNVTVADAIKNLHENGIEVTEKQAAEILDFLYFLAHLSVKAYFNENTLNSDEQENTIRF